MNTLLSRTQSLNLGLLLLRLILGVVFVFHGGQKLFGLFGGYGLEATAGWMEGQGIPLPTISALLAGGAEFFGGLVFIAGLGIGTRLAAIPLAITMLVACSMHSGFSAQNGGFEYPLTLAVASAALFFTGPGAFSIGPKPATAAIAN